MPLFEFVCEKCNEMVEVLQKFDDPSPICEKDKTEMKRVISKSFVRFRGAGFYSVDYDTPKMGEFEE